MLCQILISFVSFIMIFIGVTEILCAQIPYSMKGVIVRLLYAPVLVLASLNVGIETIFNVTSSSWRGGTLISYGFWYLQIKLILVFIAFLFLILWSVL